ncbi:TIGR00269 family protein, partial [Candidatus Woesearchaeota archaeon]|nr:TIGR00269 family protein [Candidatus Woesearchaeota archaeon]
LKGNLELGMGGGPETGVVRDKKFVPRIKPLYFCLNAEIKRYSQIKNFPVLYAPCPCRKASFRARVRETLDELEKKEPKVKDNIVQVFLKTLPQLRKKYKGKTKVNYCQVCQEPSRGEVCKMCGMLQMCK